MSAIIQAPPGPGSNGIYSDSRIFWNSGNWCYDGLTINGEVGLFPTLKLTVDSRTNTLLNDLISLFKRHARIDWSDDDDLCELYLTGAISRIEQYCVLPISPVAYEWMVPEHCMDYRGYELPLRNCVLEGDQYGFELLISKKIISKPTQWPVILELGFDSGVKMPTDLKLAVFQLALALYEFRSNPEMINIYAADVMSGNLSRYWVPRC
jgi:hypothetical protein